MYYQCFHCMYTYKITLPLVPSGIINPSLSAQGPNTIQISWSEPTAPNSASITYNILQIQQLLTTVLISSSTTGSFLLSNLQPFSAYSFLLEVCNVAGCGNSSVITVTTEEDGKYEVFIIFL